jgi:hypothetical protein
MSIAPEQLVAVTVVRDGEEAERIEKQWSEHGIMVPLEVVHSRRQEISPPPLSFVEELESRWSGAVVNVLIPESYVEHWWGHLLHNQSTLILKGRLLFKKQTAATSIPYRVESAATAS